MLFFWAIQLWRRIVWLFSIPRPEDVAFANENIRCPVCGKRRGWLRCVLKVKDLPMNKEVPPTYKILCQHTCQRCGARWFDEPIIKNAVPSTVLPAVPRNQLEEREDRHARLYEEVNQPN